MVKSFECHNQIHLYTLEIVALFPDICKGTPRTKESLANLHVRNTWCLLDHV